MSINLNGYGYSKTGYNNTSTTSTSHIYEVRDADIYKVKDTQASECYTDAEDYKKEKRKFFNAKIKTEKERKQSLLSILVKKKIIFGHTLIFAPQKSPCISNLMSVAMSDKIKIQVFDPLLLYDEDKEPLIEEYDFVVVADLLERLPDMMSRAAIIKEALISLRTDGSHSYVILAVRNKQTVEEMNEKEKDKLKIIEGIDTSELKSMSMFAGAKNTWSIKELEEEGVSYIGASFSNRKYKANITTL